VTPTIQPAPVRRAVTVQANQAKAFEIFTAGFGRWWRRTGAGIGGRWYEIGEDDVQTDWGRVLAWEPNGRLLLAWQIGADWRFDPDLVTEVEVRFIAEGPNTTRVELEHRNLERIGEAAARYRALIDSPDGWMDKLEKFAREIAEVA
jgi:hypothetical protein